MPDEERGHRAWVAAEVADISWLSLSDRRGALQTDLASQNTSDFRFYSDRAKRTLDLIGAAFLLLLFAPILLVTACLIWIMDGRPVFFVQERVGRDGETFRLLKFRTMVRDAESILLSWKREEPQLWDQYIDNNFKIPKDPRLLPCGAFLRRFSIDELPQLWNVIRGEMSLVGPRPILAREIPDYRDMRTYVSVRPGITGLWQIRGRSMLSFEDRESLDHVYIRHVTFAGDLLIMVKTIAVVLRPEGAY
jgi:undecaprenyl-phosphate galactose phosphotransferase